MKFRSKVPPDGRYPVYLTAALIWPVLVPVPRVSEYPKLDVSLIEAPDVVSVNEYAISELSVAVTVLVVAILFSR